MTVLKTTLLTSFMLFVGACGQEQGSYHLDSATPLTIIICKGTAADTKAQFIEHMHIRSSDDNEIKAAKQKTKEQALKLCKRYSDSCSASCN